MKPNAVFLRDRVLEAVKNSKMTQAAISGQALRICPQACKQLLSNACVRGARPRSKEVRDAFAAAMGADSQALWDYVPPLFPIQAPRPLSSTHALPGLVACWTALDKAIQGVMDSPPSAMSEAVSVLQDARHLMNQALLG